MNKLDLVRRFCMEAGISTVGPTSTTNQSGEFLRNVQWIEAAYNSIQVESNWWSFLRDDFSITTVLGTSEYTVDDLAEFITDDLRVYSSIADETYMEFLEWSLFKSSRLIGSSRTTQGRPMFFAVKPDFSLVVSPVPDAAYTITGEYFKNPDTMEEDDDTPIFPIPYHMVIVWRALLLSGAYSAEPDKYIHGKNEHDELMLKMKAKFLPQMTWGEPLA